MTETMMIIIVAGVVIMAFGLLCLIFISRSQKETQGFAKKIGALEKDLGDITKMVFDNAVESQKADENILQYLKQQEAKCAEKEAARKAEEEAKKAEAAQAFALPPEPKAETKLAASPKPKAAPKPEPVIEKPAPKPADPKPAIVTPAVEVEPEIDLNFDEIDINDLLDDLEDVLPELKTDFAPAVETKKPEIITPPIEHIDYDIGKSGRKYTASELEMLIRE